MAFEIPKLDYSYDALEPYIDAKTMDIHYNKHHGGYASKLNGAVSGTGNENKSIEDILSNVSSASPAVRNNGGGYYNHNLFWKLLTPKSPKSPVGDVAKAINDTFGSFDEFKKKFSDAAATRFGSGWAWLVKTGSGLVVTSTPNQDNPLMDIAEVKGTPILALDVWEHAYYLNYQNRRPEYIEAFWNIVNWEEVNSLYSS